MDDRAKLESAQAQVGPDDPTAPWVDALECVIGKAHAVLPASRVRGVLELELSAPPPLGRRWLGGLGSHEGRVVVCISLMRAAPTVPRMGKGLLCVVPESDVGWLVEASRILSFLRVRRVSRAVAVETPPWVIAAQTPDGRLVAYVDVELMVRELAGTA